MAEKKGVKKRFFVKEPSTESVDIVVDNSTAIKAPEPVVKVIKPEPVIEKKIEPAIVETPVIEIPVVEEIPIEPIVVETPVLTPPVNGKFKLVRIVKSGISFREEVIMVGNKQDCLIAETDYRKKYTAEIYRLLIKRSR